MRLSDYELYHDMLKDTMGLSLAPERTFLVDSRLLPVARKWGYNNLQSLAIALRVMPPEDLLADVAEAMITTETSFFRDGTPFDDLVNIALPALLHTRARQKKLRIWSCGCGTGQEAWSIAIALKNTHPQLAGWKIEILATDLSHRSLAVAADATYTQAEIQRGLPVKDLLAWFEPAGKRWRVKDELRRMVTFESFNLTRDEMTPGRMFDLVFFRHVMEDFAPDTRAMVLEKVTSCVPDDGFLMLGPAENPAGLYEPLMHLPENPGLFVIGEIPAENGRDALAR